MEQISVEEYATLRGCTTRYVRKLIYDGKLRATETFGNVGKGGLSYLIPLASCDPKIIQKYNRLHGIKTAAPQPEKPYLIPQSMEKLSDEERKEVAFWKKILNEWNEYRNESPLKKGEADEEYVRYLNSSYPGQSFSVRMLYRKKKAQTEHGDCALADARGKHDNHKKKIPDQVFDIFEYYYLDESKKSVRICVELTELELKNMGELELLPLASVQTFARAIEQRIPVPVLKYFRLGQKACKDECAPYIKRTYDDLNANDIWVCDNHTFDIFVDDGEHKKPIRVYLTAFLDVRSRKMVGWYVTDAPSSDATLQALRRGIERYGIPNRILSDNGREFLTHDIGGRGFRKNGRKDEHYIPTILDNLGIEFRTALVKNARAKIVERAFLDVKECFSKLFEGYTGGHIKERPERLKTLAKKASNFTPYEDFEVFVDKYIEGIFNHEEHSGIGMNGKTRNQVYAETLYEMKVATPEELNLMMMRNSRMVTVQKDGIVLKLYGTQLTFWSPELAFNYINEKVYYRYNPDDLSEIRVYDEKDRFLCTAQQKTALSYFASKEEVAEKMREMRQYERTISAYKKQKGIHATDALELMLNKAEENIALGESLNPRIIVPIRKLEDTEEQREAWKLAAGAEGSFERIDWTEGLERLANANK